MAKKKNNRYYSILIIFIIIAIVGALLYFSTRQQDSSTTTSTQSNVLSQAMIAEINANTARLYDVRTPEEYTQQHAKGAVNLPLDVIKKGTVPPVLKNKRIYVYCKSGNRSAQAKQLLDEAGYSQVINLGGLTDIQSRLTIINPKAPSSQKEKILAQLIDDEIIFSQSMTLARSLYKNRLFGVAYDGDANIGYTLFLHAEQHNITSGYDTAKSLSPSATKAITSSEASAIKTIETLANKRSQKIDDYVEKHVDEKTKESFASIQKTAALQLKRFNAELQRATGS